MSHHRQVGLLAHYQPVGARPTYIPRDVAAELVRRLGAEPIRQGLIRMLPPNSILSRATIEPFAAYIPEKLPPREVENCKFKAPPASATGIPRTHYLPGRREMYGEWQMRVSLSA